jgi:TetR/AcrR family transcriptional regulator, transcriptional repressor of aconitase
LNERVTSPVGDLVALCRVAVERRMVPASAKQNADAIAEENMREIVAMIQTIAADEPDRSVGAILADIFDIVRAKHAEDGLAGLALLVWAEALSNQQLRDRLTALLTQLGSDLSQAIRDRQRSGAITGEARADAIAGLLISTVPGYIVQLALVGPAAVKAIPAAALALWP